MERVNHIWNHTYYRECLGNLMSLEQDREFCRHTPEHFLDVARLTYLFVLERNITIDPSVIYAAALLHDIGRVRQYQEGIPHDEASAQIAGIILPDCGYSFEETRTVVDIILSHRRKENTDLVNGLFYQADKMSRNCFCCSVKDKCNWPDEKKNLWIQY